MTRVKIQDLCRDDHPGHAEGGTAYGADPVMLRWILIWRLAEDRA